MVTILIGGIVLGSSLLAFGLGGLAAIKYIDDRDSARVIRPVHITIVRPVKATKYTVQPGALDLDFPEVRHV